MIQTNKGVYPTRAGDFVDVENQKLIYGTVQSDWELLND